MLSFANELGNLGVGVVEVTEIAYASGTNLNACGL